MRDSLPVLLLWVFLTGLNTCTASAADLGADDDVLDIASSIELPPGSPSLNITLKNLSDRAACVPSSDFVATQNNADIIDDHGKLVERQVAGTGRMVDFHAVNIADPLYILFPQTPLNFDYDLKPYALRPGTYKFKLDMLYYVCRKVVALEAVKSSEDRLLGRGVTVTGSFRLPPKN